ncbi:hypothetical protein EYF80_056275 [Liparis tanakae]|uniref:Uncharacterized protein n=1 Tax=Liparis tanakae TaxID=230148 RepID=A0A4Z2EY99_9TELE|nr:hypothetical protein EYF80_056275 [Liparis tanakae]
MDTRLRRIYSQGLRCQGEGRLVMEVRRGGPVGDGGQKEGRLVMEVRRGGPVGDGGQKRRAGW